MFRRFQQQYKGRASITGALAALTLALVSSPVTASERVGDFALLDHNGMYQHMAWYDNNKAIALLVQANGSEETREALDAYKRLEAEYGSRNIEFMMINPTGTQSRESVKQEVASYGTEMPVLIDHAQLISESMGIDKLGEVFLFDPSSFEVIYRGPVEEHLEKALSEVVAGKSISSPEVAMQATPVTYPARERNLAQGVSYSEDVAPILAENCASCHREGGIAPFAMDSHAMVQGWSPMIREVLMTKRMPPGQIDPHVGEFRNDYVISDADQQKIVHWIEAGSPKDGSSDPLAELTWPETEWAFGEPDLIVELPPQQVPATGVLDYRNVVVPFGLEEDRWVKASQYVAGDRTVLHHTLNSIIPPGATGVRNPLAPSDPNEAFITAYIPGAAPYMEPPNTGGLLKAGSALALQLHYTTTGKETVDNSRIGIWFYPKGEEPEERRSGECACIFPDTWVNIPPNDPDYEMSKAITLEKDANILSFIPHMHFRGKRMRFAAHFPDGTVKELINIANYNYNWQMEYHLEEPQLVPAGTKIVATAAFDNSTQNPANPDPERSVPWGQQSWDEMFFGQVYWKYVDQESLTNPSTNTNATASR